MAASPDSPFWPADNPAVLEHIKLLQGIISRLASNSTSCKTWCLGLVCALLGLAGTTRTPAIIGFALVPVAVFGVMDTLYLAQESAYRDLYKVIVAAVRDGSYSIATVFEARAPLTLATIWRALTSWSILPVYPGLALTYLLVRWAGALAFVAAAAPGGATP